MNIVKLQDIKLTHRNLLHSYKLSLFADDMILYIENPKDTKCQFISPMG